MVGVADNGWKDFRVNFYLFKAVSTRNNRNLLVATNKGVSTRVAIGLENSHLSNKYKFGGFNASSV